MCRRLAIRGTRASRALPGLGEACYFADEMSLYVALKFVHLLGVAVFLFAHGVAAGASLLLRQPVAASARQLLTVSQRSAIVANPALLVIVITGVWMGFVGSWWGQVWIWAAI